MIDSSDIRRLLDSGCISPEQADQIKKLYGLVTYPPRETPPPHVESLAEPIDQSSEKPVPNLQKIIPSPPIAPRPESPFILFIKRNYLAVILSVLGAFLIIGGLSTLVVANWQNTPRWVKMLEAVVLMGGFWAGGFYLKEIKGKFARTGTALYVIGMCMWGICLKLYSFLYNVSSSPAQGLLLFTAGIAAFPWILRIKALFAIFMVSVLLWGASSMNDPDAPWAFQTLVPLIGLCFWGLGAALPFIAKGYYSLYARMSKITGIAIFLFSLLYMRVQNWGEISFQADFLPLAVIGAAGILWDSFDDTAPAPMSQGSKFWNRKTFVYGAASLLSLAVVSWVPLSINWIVLILLSISAFFLSGTSSRSEKITLLAFLTLLCLLPPSVKGWGGSSFFFHGIFIAPLILAFSSILRNQGKFTNEANVVNNIGIGFYMALAGYSVCDSPLLPNGFIHILQMVSPWVFAMTLFIRERDRESLVQSAIMLCITVAALIGSTDAGFWISAALLIYLFVRVEKKCISSLVFASWLYGCLIFSLKEEFMGIALPILLIALIKRGIPSSRNSIGIQNVGLFAVSLIEVGLLIYGISLIGSSLTDIDHKAAEWIKILPVALIPLCFWAIEEWKEKDWSISSMTRNIAFLLIIPGMLFNSQMMFILCLFFWVSLSVMQRASSIASLLENPRSSEQKYSFTQSTVFQSLWMLLFLVLLTILSRKINFEFLPKYASSWRLFYFSPVLPAIYTAAILIYRSGHQRARNLYGTIAALIPAFALLIISLLPVVEPRHAFDLCLFTILPWILCFGILSIKQQWKYLIPGAAALLITVTGLFLPEWSLLTLLCLLLFVSFVGNAKQPTPFLIHGFGLLIITIITGIFDQFSVPSIPLAFLAGSLLFHNTPAWKPLSKCHLSAFAVLALCLLTTSHADVIAVYPSTFAISICSSIAIACFIRLGISIKNKLYPSPIFSIIDTTMLIAMVASMMWVGSFTTTFLMLGYALFRVVTWNNISVFSPMSSLVTGCLFSFAVFISVLSPLNAANPIFGSILYIALLTAMAGGKVRHETENLKLANDAGSISRIGQALTLALFLPLSAFYSELRNTEISVIWLISILLIPAWMVLSTAISKRKFLPEILLLCLPVFLFIESVPATLQLALFALCGFSYLISGYRTEITSTVKKYQFETILGLCVFALLPMGITSCHGVLYDPLPFFALYLPILLMTTALYAKPFQIHPVMLLQKTGLFAFIILSQFYCYTDNSTRIDWSTLCFFALPGALMLIPLLVHRKFFGTPLIILMVTAAIAVPVICPNFSLGYVIASLILMGASFLALGMRICSATYVTSGIIMMSLVSFSIIFRVFDSRVERGLSLLICGIAFLILAFIAERTRHFLVKKMNEQSTSTPS